MNVLNEKYLNLELSTVSLNFVFIYKIQQTYDL